MNQAVTRSQASVSESDFLSKVFLWMSAGLFLSAGASFWTLTQPWLMKAIFTNRLFFFGLIIAEVGLVIWLSAAAQRMSAAMATSVFLAYAFLNGLTLSAIFVVYTGGSILSTFAITAGTFFFFSVYGMTTKKDLTGLGSLAMMGLIGVILASVVNIFLKSTMLTWITTFVGIAVFLGLIAYDTQKLKAIHASGFQNEEDRKRMAILGALALYLDFINLFILLLRVFGRRRD
jgi:FtsH-binding integral membrane protein